jgi:hypothetical protein
MSRALLCLVMLGLAACAGRDQVDPVAAARNGTPILPTYCYKTLAQVDCYAEPLESEVRRLVNYDGPPPKTFGYSGSGRR